MTKFKKIASQVVVYMYYWKQLLIKERDTLMLVVIN